MKTITTRHLKHLRACPEQVVLFRDTFGSSVEVTETAFVMAMEVGLNVRWLISKPIVDAYFAARKPIEDAYDAARKPIEDAYYAAAKPIGDAYDAAAKPIRDASDEELYRMLIEM
jgi:hypothetical protein